MKYILSVLMFTLLLFLIPQTTYASSAYKSYEEFNLESGKLLSEYTQAEYDKYYKLVDKRKFLGWEIHEVYKDLKAYYITETLFSYHNQGTTPIDYNYKYTKKEYSKLSLSATGTIGLKVTGDKKGFKNNLDTQLKLSAEYTNTKEESETFEIKLKVDPGTQLDLYIYGEGKITNGVAAYYLGFIRIQRGGYEVFLVTTQYQRLEKILI